MVRIDFRQRLIVDVPIELGWNDEELRVVGESLYSTACSEAGASMPGGIAPTRFDLERTPAGFVLRVDGIAGDVHRSLRELFQDAEIEITERALDQLRHRYLPLHAAAIAFDGLGLLVFGGHDAGKTSLACMLATSRAALLSDEVAPLRTEDLTVYPFPRDLILHYGKLSAWPEPPTAPAFKTFQGYRYVQPEQVGSGPAPCAVRVAGLLFPERVAGASPSLDPASPALIGRKVLEQCFDLEGIGGARAIDSAARMAQLPACALTVPLR
jgi:hypothetical protein